MTASAGGGRRRTGLLVALILAVLLAGVGALVALPGHPGPVAGAEASTSTSVATGPTCSGPGASSTSSLLTHLFIAAPQGFVRAPDATVKAGPLGAAQLADASSQPSAVEEELGLDGFEGAALRVWIDRSADEQAQVTLVEFSCAAGASEYFNTQAAGSFGITGGAPFQVAGWASARGERSTRPDGKGHYLQVVASTDGDIYEETATFTPKPDDGSLAGSVSQLQAGSLGTI